MVEQPPLLCHLAVCLMGGRLGVGWTLLHLPVFSACVIHSMCDPYLFGSKLFFKQLANASGSKRPRGSHKAYPAGCDNFVKEVENRVEE